MKDDSIGGTSPDTIEKDGTIYVAEKKRTNLVSAILLILAGMFLLIGIASLGTILGIIQSTIMLFLSSLTGWNPILANLFIGILFLFGATLIYVVVRRTSEVSQKIEAALRLNITNEPTEYYALDMIPSEEILSEFKHRGCTLIKGEGKGITIECSDMPHSRRIIGVVDPTQFTLSRLQKVSVISVVLVIWAVFVGTLIYDIIFDDFVWIVGIVLMVISVIILLGSRVIKLWHTIIIWTAVNIVFSLFFAVEPSVLWSLWGAEAVYAILVAISYLLYPAQCKVDDKWFCDVL